jgi:hypothetical protein
MLAEVLKKQKQKSEEISHGIGLITIELLKIAQRKKANYLGGKFLFFIHCIDHGPEKPNLQIMKQASFIVFEMVIGG